MVKQCIYVSPYKQERFNILRVASFQYSDYDGYDGIHILRLTLWYSATIQKDIFFFTHLDSCF